MSDYAVTIELPDHKLGDEWIGIAIIGPVSVTGITKGTLSRIRMTLHSPIKTKPFVIDSQTGWDAEIVIDDATTWEAHIDPVTEFVQMDGEWRWDMQFFHSGDISPITLYKGVLTVLPRP